MQERKYESTLNTWLAAALRKQGLDAREESGQGGGKRLDVEVRFDQINIALEAEQGYSTSKRASAIKDADSRLRDDLADCAFAICYPDGLWTAGDLSSCEVLHTLRTHKDRPAASKTEWKQDNLAQFVSVIRKVPDQLGDPDNIANALSFSLDRPSAFERKSKALAACLDLPQQTDEKSILAGRIAAGSFRRQARSVVSLPPPVQASGQAPRGIAPYGQARFLIQFYKGDWPPPWTTCASDDPSGILRSWDLWLAVDYKAIFATPAMRCEAAPVTVIFRKRCGGRASRPQSPAISSASV